MVEVDPHAPKPKTRSLVGQAKKQRASKLAAIFQASEHDVVRSGSKKNPRFSCAKCQSNVTRRVLKDWLKKPCVPANHLGAANPVACRFAMGGSSSHPSHTLKYYKDRKIWVCTACGLCAFTKMHGLSKECAKTPTRRGKQNLAMIERGDFPGCSRADKEWHAKRKPLRKRKIKQ